MRMHQLWVLSLCLLASPATLLAQSPFTQPDQSWISLDGQIQSVDQDRFVLDFGPSWITVELDDRDRDAGSYTLEPGDKVRVTGMIDDDLFEKRTIEASSVYIEKEGTYFFASHLDDEDRGRFASTTPVNVSDTVFYGTVTSVDDDSLTMLVGQLKLQVDVSQLPESPLDDEGYQQIKVGDFISVSGKVDPKFFDETHKVVAARIVTLDQADRRNQ